MTQPSRGNARSSGFSSTSHAILGDVDDIFDQNLRSAKIRMFILLLEHELRHFLLAANKNEKRSPLKFVLPELGSFYRFLVHKVCDRFQLRSSSVGWGRSKTIEISMNNKKSVW